MQLINPLGLISLLSLPVIIALHLLRERRRQEMVSHLPFWDFLEPEVRGSLPSRVPFSWLLIADLLLASLLSLALAQPRVNIPIRVRDAKQIVLLIDVSTSMQATDVIPSRLDQAKMTAISLLSDLGPHDQATVISFASVAEVIGDTRYTDLPNIIDKIKQLHGTHRGSALAEALALSLTNLRHDMPVKFYVLTDAAYSNPYPDGLRIAHHNYSVEWRIFAEDVGNQAVLEISSRSLGKNKAQIFSRIGNFGSEISNNLITLYSGEIAIDSTTIEIPAQSSMAQVWEVVIPNDQFTVSLASIDPYNIDNEATIGVHVDQSLEVALVSNSSNPIQNALSAFPNLELHLLSPDEYLPGMVFDLVVFHQTLPDDWPDTNILVVDPPQDHQLLPVVGKSEIGLPPIPGDSPLFEGVDFSGVRWEKVWDLAKFPEGFVSLLDSGNQSLLIHQKLDGIQNLIFLADLNSGNIARHPAFLVLLGNYIDSLRTLPLPQQIKIGEKLYLPAAYDYPIITITTPTGEILRWGSVRPPSVEASETGVFHVELIDKNGDQHEFVIGVNAGDKEESKLRPSDWVEGIEHIGETKAIIVDHGLDLTPYFLAIAVLLLGWEAYLAWR